MLTLDAPSIDGRIQFPTKNAVESTGNCIIGAALLAKFPSVMIPVSLVMCLVEYPNRGFGL